MFLSDSEWFSLVLNCCQQFSILHRSSIVLFGSQLLQLALVCYQWFSMVTMQWFSMILSGSEQFSEWFTLVLSCYQYFSIVLSGSQLLSVVVCRLHFLQVALIGYQWSGAQWLQCSGSHWLPVVLNGLSWFSNSIVLSVSQLFLRTPP